MLLQVSAHINQQWTDRDSRVEISEHERTHKFVGAFASVFFGRIHVYEIARAIMEGNIVALETSRPHARHLAAEIDATLFPRKNEVEPRLTFLTTDVIGRWTPFLVPPSLKLHDPRIMIALVRDAVERWGAAGSPDRSSTRVAVGTRQVSRLSPSRSRLTPTE